jgi:hypothetical protein
MKEKNKKKIKKKCINNFTTITRTVHLNELFVFHYILVYGWQKYEIWTYNLKQYCNTRRNKNVNMNKMQIWLNVGLKF